MWPHQWKYRLYFFSRLFFFFLFHSCACWCVNNEPMFEEENRWKRLILFCSRLVVNCLIMRATLSGCLVPFIVFYISFSVNLCFCPPPPTDVRIKASPWPLSSPDPTQRLGRRSASLHIPQYEIACRERSLSYLFFSRHAFGHLHQKHLNIDFSSSQTVPPLFSLIRPPG